MGRDLVRRHRVIDLERPGQLGGLPPPGRSRVPGRPVLDRGRVLGRGLVPGRGRLGRGVLGRRVRDHGGLGDGLGRDVPGRGLVLGRGRVLRRRGGLVLGPSGQPGADGRVARQARGGRVPGLGQARGRGVERVRGVGSRTGRDRVGGQVQVAGRADAGGGAEGRAEGHARHRRRGQGGGPGGQGLLCSRTIGIADQRQRVSQSGMQGIPWGLGRGGKRSVLTQDTAGAWLRQGCTDVTRVRAARCFGGNHQLHLGASDLLRHKNPKNRLAMPGKPNKKL